MPSTRAGSTRCSGEPQPIAGSTCQPTANTATPVIARITSGNAARVPHRAPSRALSGPEPAVARHTGYASSSVATAAVTTSADADSVADRSNAGPTISVTGRPLDQLTPKSPPTAELSHCHTPDHGSAGRSSCLRNASTASGSSPRA